nr:MAG TPA: hypothetical protein [Bacteriophage sp.]
MTSIDYPTHCTSRLPWLRLFVTVSHTWQPFSVDI